MKLDVEELETADYDILENIKTALYRLWKMKWLVVIMTLAGCGLFFIYIGIVGVHTNYYASASIYSAAYGSYEDTTGGVAVMNTYAPLLSSTRVSERAAIALQDEGISAAQLRGMVASGMIYLSGASSNSKSYGYKLSLSVESPYTNKVDKIANAMSKAFADEINDLIGIPVLQVLDEATGYMTAPSIRTKLFLFLFGAAAFVLTCIVIFCVSFFSPKVYSVLQCECEKENILGMIPYHDSKQTAHK